METELNAGDKGGGLLHQLNATFPSSKKKKKKHQHIMLSSPCFGKKVISAHGKKVQLCRDVESKGSLRPIHISFSEETAVSSFILTEINLCQWFSIRHDFALWGILDNV